RRNAASDRRQAFGSPRQGAERRSRAKALRRTRRRKHRPRPPRTQGARGAGQKRGGAVAADPESRKRKIARRIQALRPDGIKPSWCGNGNSPLPSGEVGAQRRVRGYGPSLERRPSPDLLRKSTSPEG